MKPIHIGGCLDEAARRLVDAGIVGARKEARLLMGYWLNRDPAQLFGPQYEEVGAPESFFDLVDRRVGREPLSHLVGRREFWSLEFEVSDSVLDPRPDSEVLIETGLLHWPNRSDSFSVLDLGTGSGCLLLSLLRNRPRAIGVGVDVSGAALEIARRNAARIVPDGRAQFLKSDWGSSISQPFDLVVANPPYIPSNQISELDAEVTNFEPLLALDGGLDGLDAYRAIAEDLVRLTTPTGIILLEIGSGQSEQVASILEKSGLVVKCIKNDLAGRNRCLVAHHYVDRSVK